MAKKYPNFLSAYAHDFVEAKTGSIKGESFDKLSVNALESLAKNIELVKKDNSNLFKMYINETTHLN
jgi:hypothetical protein